MANSTILLPTKLHGHVDIVTRHSSHSINKLIVSLVTPIYHLSGISILWQNQKNNLLYFSRDIYARCWYWQCKLYIYNWRENHPTWCPDILGSFESIITSSIGAHIKWVRLSYLLCFKYFQIQSNFGVWYNLLITQCGQEILDYI